MSSAALAPLCERTCFLVRPSVQVTADSINDISAYASEQDKFSPGEGASAIGDRGLFFC